MIKSFSVSDTQNTSPFSGQTQPYLKPAQFHDDDLVLENIKQASYFLSAESNANLSPTPGDRSKKRIKLRVNQKFPTDFFDQPPDEGQENNRTYYLKNIPVKVVRTPEVLQAKNATMGEQRHANNTPSFGSQLMTSMDPSLHAEDRTISSRNKLFEGPPSREMITDIKHNTQARSRSHERGSFTGAGLYSLRMRPQALNSKLRLEEIGQNYSSIGGNIPLQPIENDQRSTSRLKRGGLQTPRKDTLSSFRKPRQVTFNLNSEEKLHESIASPIAETSHVVITNSYYYSSRGINYQGDQAAGNPVKQPEDDFQSLQAYRKEPLKLAKSASRDSFHRENEFLRISRTNRLYLKAINKEQASLPLASTRKTLRALKADESENSRMTSDREIAEHQFIVDSNQINEKNAARQKIVPHKSFANFHKTLIKSLGLSPQEPLTTKNAGLVTKPIAMLDNEPKKENSIDLITKIGRKVAEQRNIRDITESYMMREGHDFSFSKEYSKDESSIPTFKAQGKDVREKSPSPEKLEFVEQRNIGSRSQTRIRKKFVLIKRDESNEKSK